MAPNRPANTTDTSVEPDRAPKGLTSDDKSASAAFTM